MHDQYVSNIKIYCLITHASLKSSYIVHKMRIQLMFLSFRFTVLKLPTVLYSLTVPLTSLPLRGDHTLWMLPLF